DECHTERSVAIQDQGEPANEYDESEDERENLTAVRPLIGTIYDGFLNGLPMLALAFGHLDDPVRSALGDLLVLGEFLGRREGSV
ncbi:MAG TPA: hypothetical protein VHN37_01435, partial [Actinomycetota bacterium]|nr:hypothetical protein [Actinomycetota bacterium]